ncbi:MAG TPA: ABC transporter permease, partial [Candidatus Limnocylindrales bacterium]|nr:ABC transporter permease [Candidatus Limnocylindrales bacterium]
IPRLMPGNPIQALEAAHPHLDPQSIHALTTLLGGGYQGSLISQYFTYWGRVLTFNFGISITTSFGTSVATMVLHALPWTIGLVGVTTVLAFILGTLIGLVSAWRRGSWLDNALPPIFIITSAFPYFWVGLILIYVFAIRLGIFPGQGAYNFLNDSPGWNGTYVKDVFEHAVLPGLTILLTAIGGWILTMRNNVITVMAEDYVRTARAKGLKPWRIMWAYVGRNAILPNLAGFAMSLGFVVSGAIVVEYVFNYPGLGTLLLTAVQGLDYPLMQALFLLITFAVLLSVLAADVVTAIIDPRTREAS